MGSDFRKISEVTLVDSGGTTPTLLVASPVPRWVEWTATPIVVTSSAYVLAWQTSVETAPASFYEAVWQVNSDDMYLKVEVGSVVLVNGILLKDLDKKFKLKGDDDIGTRPFSIWEYESKRWSFKPPVSIAIDVGDKLKISFKSKGGDKQIERGISVWGVV